MKKKVFGKKFSRAGKSRKALFRSLTRSLVLHGSIVTTDTKAKAVQFYAENLINIAKVGSLASRRRVYAKLGNDRVTTDKIFNIIIPLFVSRKGGYMRVIPMAARRGDGASLAKIEWVEKVVDEEKKKKDKSEKSEAATKTKDKNAIAKEGGKKFSSQGLKGLLKKSDKNNENDPHKSAAK